MPRRVKSVVRKTGDAIARTARNLTARLNPRNRAAANATEAPPINAKAAAKPRSNPPLARATRRTSDVPLDLLGDTYAPKQTSVRGSFRSDGTDQQNDQEIPLGAGDRFQNEDHFTNKSGDVRIGTHGRTYEPGEART
ncbi:MAG TPA: hypothetical protein VNN08_15595 [Thermoanaerobaculia bacterium]|nr:hypothetical protein [Thermoanaerobaculia bacterium]